MNNREYRIKKENCQETFLGGKTDPTELALIFGVSEITVRKWIKSGHWEELAQEERRLDHDIKLARKKALIQALREYSKNPADTALQSLVSLIKHDQRENEPAKELNDYIIRFLDQSTDYMIEKGHETLLKSFQEILLDLAEYLRLKNG
jgi:transcription elongation factor GreA-like protein